MQEIAPRIYIETGYAGVTLGAINWPHGLILIDSPFRQDDVRTWRATLLNLGGGVDRLLVNLDAHLDRTLGARAMDCTIIGHEKMAQVFRTRPVTFKLQSTDTGSEWEMFNSLGSIRWAPPEITFTNQSQIFWNDEPLTLQYRPGPSTGSIWAVLPEEHIIFLGDAVVPNQPPFLANADLPAWIETLQALLSRDFRNYTLISGRAGMVAYEQVRIQIHFLEKVHTLLEAMGEKHEPVEKTESLVSNLLKSFNVPADRKELYTQRLRWGLYQYYTRHYRSNNSDEIVE